MKIVTINKIKVKVFEEDDLLNKLKMSKEDCDLVLQYQRIFPELLQDGVDGFVISSKLLHKQLSVGKDYSTWIKNRINKCGFVENSDYIIKSMIHQDGGIKKSKGGDRKSKDYYITLDMAKQLCMIEKNDIGFLTRNYFIKMESALRNYEKWCDIREPEKKNYNYMLECLNSWCKNQGFDYTDKVFKTRECNMINVALTGKTALELKLYIGYKDKLTREHLSCDINKAKDELQILNSSLLISNMSFIQRKEIIENVCRSRFSNLYIRN